MLRSKHLFLITLALSMLFISSRICVPCLIHHLGHDAHCTTCDGTGHGSHHEEGEHHEGDSCCCESDDHAPNPAFPAAGSQSVKLKAAGFAGIQLVHPLSAGLHDHRSCIRAWLDWIRWMEHFPDPPLFLQHGRFLI